MSEPGNNPTNTNAGQTRGGRQSNPSFRGRGAGPVQRGNETTAGRSAGRGSGRSGSQYDRPGSGQQGPRRHPESGHQTLPIINPGRQQSQQFHGVAANTGAGPPGIPGPSFQFGSYTPDDVPSGNRYAPAQAAPVQQVQHYLSQGRGHPGQQPKLQQQPQHVVKASQGPVQVPMGLAGMPGGGMQQAQQFPQRQPMMQGHQIQPGQQGYPIAYQNAGFFNPPGLPPGVQMGGHQYGQQIPHQNQHQPQPQPQMQQPHQAASQNQAQGQGASQPHRTPQAPFTVQPPSFGQAQPREKKKLSLVDPNTGKPIDLGGGSGQASANGAVGQLAHAETMSTRSLSEASRSRSQVKPALSKPQVQAVPKPSPTSTVPADVPASVKSSPAESKASTAQPGKGEKSLAGTVSAAKMEESKPMNAANGSTTDIGAPSKQPRGIVKPEPSSTSKGPVEAPAKAAAASETPAAPVSEPAKAASAAPSEAPKQSKDTVTVALRSPTAVPAAKDASLDKEQPAVHAAEQKEPVKAEKASAPQVKSAENPEHKDAEPIVAAAAEAANSVVEAAAETAFVKTSAPEAAPVETTATQTTPAATLASKAALSETAASRGVPAETAAPKATSAETAAPEAGPADTAAPKAVPAQTAAPKAAAIETGASTAAPAENAAPEAAPAETAKPKAAPAPAAKAAEAAPDAEKLKKAPNAVPDTLAERKVDPAELTSTSAATADSKASNSIGEGLEYAATVQKPESPADGGPAQCVHNGDAGEHVVTEKGAGLAAAADATAELEEATTDATPSAAAAEEKKAEEPVPSAVPAAPAPSKKAKLKAALKANEGAKGGMLDAFTDPQPKPAEPKPEVAQEAPKQTPVKAAKPAAPSPEKAQSNEADDWETVAEGMTTPSAAKAAAVKASSAVTSPNSKKAYSRDWLLTLQDAHKEEPHGLMGSGLLMREGGGGGPPGGRAGPATGFDMRGGPRGAPHMGPPHSGPPGVAAGGLPVADSRWERGTMMPPPAGPPGMGGRGMMGPPPPGGGRGGPPPRGGIDGAKWQRGLQPPPPPPGAGFTGPQHGYGRPAPSLHKTGNAYKLGALVSEDPEEEKRQKDFKSFLNKLTLDNYDTIKDKIVAVGIVSEATLIGLIDQVFDKALGEPGFSGIYARLCYDLNQVLPSFKSVDAEGKEETVEFRRVLLNKCQSEFEEGAAAMLAVQAREKRQNDGEAAEAEGKAEDEDKEDGEITDSEKQSKAEEKKAKAREDAEAAQRELKARRRALGNIQFIGNLYQHRMLTERIMHSCIKELLSETDTPKAEDVECLCKLLSTIGHLLDAGKKGPMVMDAYFSRMRKVMEAKGLESRHRFMIQDVIDLRDKQHWQARRKVEGPKKIEDIHKEARMEQQRARMAPPPDRRDRRDRIPDRPAMPMRPERSRLDDRVDAPIRAMNRAPSYEYLAKDNALRPGGGAAREPSMPSLRPGGPGALGAGAGARGSGIRTPSPAREPAAASAAPATPAPPPSAPAAEEVKELSPDEIALRSKNLVEEYLTNKDPKELFLSIQELSVMRTDMSAVVEGFFDGAFSSKGIDRDGLVDMLIVIAKKQDQKDLTAKHLEAGLKLVVDSLDQTFIDVPFAPKLVGKAIGALVAQGVLELKPMVDHVLKAESEAEPDRGEDEDAALIDSGEGIKVITASLERLRADKGVAAAKDAWTTTGLSLLDFVPKFEREDEGKLQEILVKDNLQSLYPLAGIQSYLPAALTEGKSAADIGDWIRENSGDAADSPEFAEFLAVQLFPHMLGPSPDSSKPMFKADSGFVPLLLTFVANRSNQEVAMVWGAQKIYEDRERPKGLLRRMLTDLHDLRIVSGQALETWRYKTNDTEAIKDVSSWLDEVKQSEEGAE